MPVLTFAKVLAYSVLYRKTAVSVLLIAFILQSFSQVLIMGDYFINMQNYVAQCINKDKPEMHCNGQCRMAEKMQKENNNDKNNPQTNIEISVVYFVADFSSPAISAPVSFSTEKKFPVFQESATFQQPQDIFRPPILA